MLSVISSPFQPAPSLIAPFHHRQDLTMTRPDVAPGLTSGSQKAPSERAPGLPAGADREQLVDAIRGHVIGSGELVVRFSNEFLSYGG
jgi:phosphatidylethanolamine-binding protein (PEBP) family uncharacterized protein